MEITLASYPCPSGRGPNHKVRVTAEPRLERRNTAHAWRTNPPGLVDLGKQLELSVCFTETCGVERHGYSGGQLDVEPLLFGEQRPAGLVLVQDEGTIRRLAGYWRRWHLNGMRAGCEHQRAEGWATCKGHYLPGGIYLPELRKGRKLPGITLDDRDNGVYVDAVITASYVNCAGEPESQRIGEFTHNVRCSVDRLSKPCPICGYKYGNAWLYEALPQEVVEFFEGLGVKPQEVSA